MSDEMHDIIRKIIIYLIGNNTCRIIETIEVPKVTKGRLYKIADEINIMGGKRIFRFENDDVKYRIVCKLNKLNMKWEHIIYKNGKKLNKNEIIMLYAEMNVNEQMQGEMK